MSKRKLFLDLSMMIKRGKVAGKAFNLMFHHDHNPAAFTTNDRSHHLSFSSPPRGEYEFSCSNSPVTKNHRFSLFSLRKRHHSNCNSAEDLDMVAVNAVLKAMEMIHSDTASPALPGFGRSPMVRQLRVTDSPFPLTSVDEDSHVDEAAEQFINQFYNDLRRQNTSASFGSS
ncbi:hypothetical protein L1887_11013 [Cichorium endivia]|nr:hypothetical protein L1887_11013 [Cichorium endivia]